MATQEAGLAACMIWLTPDVSHISCPLLPLNPQQCLEEQFASSNNAADGQSAILSELAELLWLCFGYLMRSLSWDR
ncbi:hypothetical protein WJX77_003217 [Trebouxia sp. C0004]